MTDRRQVLRFRVHAQQLDRTSGGLADTTVLDFGVQETGPDGAGWALAIRGVDVASLSDTDLITLWTLRGAPHRYRRTDAPDIAAAVAPYSDADAGKRIFDASKPLKAAGIGNVEALDEVAGQLRRLVTEPMVKGDVSGRLNKVLDEPYLRFCRPCDAIHIYEQPFRLAAIRAGLELRPGTSPPVLEPIPGFKPSASADERFDLVRCYLRLLGPATPKQVAEFLDAPVKDVKAHWPEDVAAVTVDGEQRWLLASDEEALRVAEGKATRLLGPYDLFLQGRDRATIQPDKARAKELWPVLGRPGAVLVDGELVGAWRPRKSGKRMSVTVKPWQTIAAATRKTISEQAERLAANRGADLSAIEFDG